MVFFVRLLDHSVIFHYMLVYIGTLSHVTTLLQPPPSPSSTDASSVRNNKRDHRALMSLGVEGSYMDEEEDDEDCLSEEEDEGYDDCTPVVGIAVAGGAGEVSPILFLGF